MFQIFFAGFEKVVGVLLRNGSDIDLKNNDGWSSLATSAFNGNDITRKILFLSIYL